MCVQLDDKLSGFRKQLADLPETVDSPEAAMLLLTERLNKVANEAKAATSPNESSIDKDLRNEDAMRFGQKFLRASEKFVNAVGLSYLPVACYKVFADAYSDLL